jgi:mRNA interferase MazF
MSMDESPPPPTNSSPAAGPAFPRRGAIYYVDLDPIVGSEQGGRRPALVIQNDIGNEFSPVVIVAAVTSHLAVRARPTDVAIEPGSSGLRTHSRILLNQIRTIDKRRLGRFVGELLPEDMARVDEAIRVSLGLVPLHR